MSSHHAGEPKSQALKCTKEEAHGGGTAVDWHKALLRSMMQSRFCMIVPGDSQSSERLTDAFVSGMCPLDLGIMKSQPAKGASK